jgi:ferredoxin
MKLHVDWTMCDGRGLCVELLPEVLAEDDWGFPVARNGNGNDLDVPKNVRAHAQRAVAQCPRSALRVTPTS